MFKLWSESKKEAKNELKPNLGLKSWNDLNHTEKSNIWKHLSNYFFEHSGFDNNEFEFIGGYPDKDLKKKRILYTITSLNDFYKVNNYTPSFLNNPNLNTACADFYSIFINQSENVVFELLSIYSKLILAERKDDEPYSEKNETEEKFKLRTIEWRFEIFDEFSNRLNKVLGDFGINILLTRLEFIPRQDKKIIEEVYEPVISFLSNSKWKEVSSILADAFQEYRKKTPQGYSNCVTNTVSAIQAFLQILDSEKTGKGAISYLITEAQKKNLIPNDFFTQKIFDNIESIFARERQEIGIAHPKKEYANERNARTILNLSMIFFQHCIQK